MPHQQSETATDSRLKGTSGGTHKGASVPIGGRSKDSLSSFAKKILGLLEAGGEYRQAADGSLIMGRHSVPLSLLTRLHRLDHIDLQQGRVRITERGIAYLKRQRAATQKRDVQERQESPDRPVDAYRHQHLDVQKAVRMTADGKQHILVNAAESPLGWLRRRRGRDGRPWLTAVQFEAGERLRETYERAGLGAKITVDLAAVPSASGGRHGGRGLLPQEHQLDARRAVRAAVDAVGPGLADILIRVCCHLEGLDEAERGLGWPARSGKLVLALGLDRLAIHYGMIAPPAREAELAC
ncbi:MULTISPECIES: DUF6456 domain-containing protein [unclassified Iodidimonas]|uniref:DUF6456 domain-containing protein n=1 Tax=unclassified Iodidimonas TaxID=2626145 RepID=UPI002482AB81|nr:MULTISPECIES: DUF6456 domain-containing protein [unclassified Iodidimonas]